MEIITNILGFYNTALSFLTKNATEILAALGAVYTIALFIVKLTPTNADNEFLDKAYKFVLGLIGKLGIKK